MYVERRSNVFISELYDILFDLFSFGFYSFSLGRNKEAYLYLGKCGHCVCSREPGRDRNNRLILSGDASLVFVIICICIFIVVIVI